MKIDGQPFRTIWLKEDDSTIVQIIDQRQLPHEFVIKELTTVDEVARAIREMWVRGAPLIGATAAFGMYIACLEAKNNPNPDTYIHTAAKKLLSTRPTAVNLRWAIDKQLEVITSQKNIYQKIEFAQQNALQLVEEDVECCREIGLFGLSIIETISSNLNGATVNILTHCNAGWLACIDWGTATSPIYQAFDKGIDLHVWVDETRPRNQGSRITAWELGKHGIPHTVITDNAGGLLMQQKKVDLCLVGTDRTTRTGDVANKIGTYLKALAAFDNEIPFYVALPSSTIDWTIENGQDIPIEIRSEEEVTHIRGLLNGNIEKVLIAPKNSKALNLAFDVTPGRLITGLITERGICEASEKGLISLFPESAKI